MSRIIIIWRNHGTVCVCLFERLIVAAVYVVLPLRIAVVVDDDDDLDVMSVIVMLGRNGKARTAAVRWYKQS